MGKNEKDFFWELGLSTIHELETETGILASSREEIYGCIFGRDSLISSLKMLKAYRQVKDKYFLDLVKKILLNLASLQGRQINSESGEEPGKCIHEYRPDNHERLTLQADKAWYVYADNAMKNYDSVDATPLFLITCFRYFEESYDHDFINQMMPNIEMALNWLILFGDSNNDGFIDYRFPERVGGGLVSQSWMDSENFLFHEDGSRAAYPVAPLEVQGYGYLAFKLWSSFFKQSDPAKSEQLQKRAQSMKALFNERFIVNEGDDFYLAAAIDGDGRQVRSVRSSMGHLLWAALIDPQGEVDCILDKKYLSAVVKRLMMPDLFEPTVGIRTLGTGSQRYDPGSYHNGSIWPHDNEMIAEGFENFGYFGESRQLREALLKAVDHFQTPLELFVYKGGEYHDYQTDQGNQACKKQAWSAAALLTAALGIGDSPMAEGGV